MDTQTTNQPRLSDYLRPLTSRWWLIVVAVIVATVAVYAYSSHKADVYTTSTLVYVTQPGNPVTGVQAPTPTDRDVADAASLLGSPANAAAVARAIGFHGTPSELLGHVSISSKQGEDFVDLTTRAGSAVETAAIANGFAKQFVTSLTREYTTQLRSAIRQARTQLSAVPPGPAGEVSRAELVNQISTLEVTLGTPTTVAKQVTPAAVPGAPSSPKPVRDALFAFLISLLGAVGLAYGLERFDRRIKSPEEFERVYNAPLLAIIPHVDDPAPVVVGESVLGGEFREPFRILRTNVELASVDAPPRTIVVSSAMPGEGKSTVVRNLALAYSESGKRVAVVDLDLRHPALAGLFFKASIGPGMTDVLRRDVPLESATLEVGSRLSAPDATLIEADHSLGAGGNGMSARNGHGQHDAGVTLLLSGALPANPPAVLASHRVAEVLDELASRHDIVLIDSAPVLAVTDTVPLLRYADAALFVGRLGVTTRDTAKRLTQFLSRVPDLNLLGVVGNDLSRLDAGPYGYGYGYGYRGESTADRREKAAAGAPKQTV